MVDSVSQRRLLVTGSRHHRDYALIREALIDAYARLGADLGTLLVHGDGRGVDDALGADRIAARVWAAWGMATKGYPADWLRYGKGAGPLRNGRMVNDRADLCLAFPLPGSTGTWDCVRKARAAGIPVIEWTRPDPDGPSISRRIRRAPE
jgi:hypothetical protein